MRPIIIVHIPQSLLSSRKGTTETAAQLVKEAASKAQGTGMSPYVRDRAHQDRLRAAAHRLQNSKLAELIASGWRLFALY